MPSHTEGTGPQRSEAIAKLMMITVIESYMAGPAGRERIFEALNATAKVAAEIVGSVCAEPGGEDALDYFDRTFQDGLVAVADRNHGHRLPN